MTNKKNGEIQPAPETSVPIKWKRTNFDLAAVAQECALSMCPKDLANVIKERGGFMGHGTCIEAVIAVNTLEALDGSKDHAKLVFQLLSDGFTSPHVEINNNTNVLQLSLEANHRIADQIRKIAFPDSSGESRESEGGG